MSDVGIQWYEIGVGCRKERIVRENVGLCSTDVSVRESEVVIRIRWDRDANRRRVIVRVS
jgi:hypothetical protein